MSLQDKIAAAQGILQKSDGNPWTPQEMAAMSQGLVLQQLLDAMAAFRGLLQSQPDDALEIVNEFKATPEFQTLTEMLG